VVRQPQNSFGNRTQHDPVEGAVAVRAHHDHLGVPFGGQPDDRGNRQVLDHHRFGGDGGGDHPARLIDQRLPGGGAGLVELLDEGVDLLRREVRRRQKPVGV